MERQKRATRETAGKRGRKRAAVAVDAAKANCKKFAAANAAEKPTTAAMALPLPEQQEKGAKNAWEAVEIKLEELDAELGVDVKPDVHELQQQMASTQAVPAAASTAAPTTTTTTLNSIKHASHVVLPVAEPPQRLIIIGDLACVAAAAAGGALTLTPLSTSNGSVGAVQNSAVAAEQSTLTKANATTAMPAQPTGTPKLLHDVLAEDAFDLQESDSDEEGYSDIDFDEDDELIEDDDEVDLYDPAWTEQLTAPRKVFSYQVKSKWVGLSGNPRSTDPNFYFDKMLSGREQFFGLLTQGCNECAHQLFGHNMDQTNFGNDFSVQEVQVFFGLCLQMSAFKLPTLAEYWQDQMHYGFKGFGSKMSQSRFQILLQVLNFERLLEPDQKETEAATPPPAAFGIVGPLLGFFNRQMKSIYINGQRLVLNEPILFWKGRLNFLRDLREKFRCNAIILHLLTENTGLILKIVPDVEREERKTHQANSKLLLEQRIGIAKEMLKDKLDSGHVIFASKYYNSYGLAMELAQRSTYCTGYLDSKRYGNSKELILNKVSSNCFAIKYATPIMMGKWCRRDKSIYFCSSDCLAISVNETTRHSNDPRPKIIKELDWQLKFPFKIKEHMQRYQVDCERKEIKWDQQIAIYVFNLMVFNAYVLYTMYAQFGRARITELHLKDTTKLKSYQEFRQDIVNSLLDAHDEGEDKPRATSFGTELAANEVDEGPASAGGRTKPPSAKHLPVLLRRGEGKVIRKRCRICYKGGMLTYSKVYCEDCLGMPGLCETPCFKIWHDQLKKSLETGERIKTGHFEMNGEKANTN